MKTPAAALQPLIDDGVIDEVIRSLEGGKEDMVYLVRSGVLFVDRFETRSSQLGL
jgi:RIO kinase 1